jgi:hypothetical protein
VITRAEARDRAGLGTTNGHTGGAAAEAPLRRLSVEDILAAPDINTLEVPVPEWGGAVCVKSFSKAQLDAIQRQSVTKDRFGKERRDDARFEALLFVAGVAEPTFTEEQYAKLAEKSAVAVGRVMQAIVKINGLSEASIVDAEKSVGPEDDAAV